MPQTAMVMKGSVATSTSVSTGSMVAATAMPPMSRMGARTPSLCIMPII